MKIPKPILFLLAAILAFGAFTPHHARAQVSVSYFYNTLDPYGEWVQDPDYGYVWHPTNVDDNWAPYTDGYWAFTDGGWTWVSYEDYGGVVYHYGRWAHVPGEGWVWVPGETWAPAWVSWRSNDDYVGWAPLPPEARWRVGVGFGGWVDARFDIGPGFYSFVGVRDFGAPALGAVIVNRQQNVTIINNTTNITNITVNNSNVYTGGPSFATIAAHSTRPIPTLKLVRQGDAAALRSAGGKALSRQTGSQLFVLAPKVTAPVGGKLPAPPHVARTLTRDGKVDHGWDVVKDPDQRASMEAKFKASAGTENTPAKPINPEDLKLVTSKVKSAGAPKALAGEAATPGKGKTGKKKTEDLTGLENAPATDQSGATAAATPKTAKGKKSHTASEDSFLNADGANGSRGDETPAPKKSKKAKTPSEFDSGDSDAPKHSKNSDSNLQPFMGGDDESKPKKASPDDADRPKAPDTGDFSADGTRPPKTAEKGGKGEKKKKAEGEPSPVQFQ
jgi:hypothetical protein